MIISKVGVPSTTRSTVHVHLSGLSALPTGATASLYYSKPRVDVAPIFLSDDKAIFAFEIDGPSVTVRGADGKDHIITAQDDCYVVINTRQVKYDANTTGSVRVTVTDGAGRKVTEETFVEGSVKTTDPDAHENVWTAPPFTQWMVAFVLNLT